jgi:hypothetical protein
MQWVESLGLANFVTELDMEIPAGDAALSQQAEAYGKITEIWLDQNNGGWLQTWGVYDKYTWLGAAARPLLFDDQYIPKPAYHSMLNALLADTHADFDADGDVDGADLLQWQRELGMPGIDASDLQSWRAQFARANETSGESVALPEPALSSIMLAAILAAFAGGTRKLLPLPYSASASSDSHRL